MVFALIVMIVLVSESFEVEVDPLSDAFIESINKEQSLWTAGRNFRRDIPMSYIRNLLGFVPLKVNSTIAVVKHNLQNVQIPESFDWRDHFPNCSSLRQIRDQGSCGSCWAHSAVEVISDRICIHSQGKISVEISAQNLVSCCQDCGDGCHGGCDYLAFEYWKNTGLVTGGRYDSSEGCQPYEIPPCEHGGTQGPLPPCAKDYVDTPKCKDTCEKGYPKSYKEDLHYGKSAYWVDNDAKQVQTEIMKNGPVSVPFTVYEDFLTYKGGIYRHHKGKKLRGHSVKIIGWGIEDDTPYWLIANSWNSDWGDAGYFKIIRGQDEADLGTFGISAGIPA